MDYIKEVWASNKLLVIAVVVVVVVMVVVQYVF